MKVPSTSKQYGAITRLYSCKASFRCIYRHLETKLAEAVFFVVAEILS